MLRLIIRMIAGTILIVSLSRCGDERVAGRSGHRRFSPSYTSDGREILHSPYSEITFDGPDVIIQDGVTFYPDGHSDAEIRNYYYYPNYVLVLADVRTFEPGSSSGDLSMSISAQWSSESQRVAKALQAARPDIYVQAEEHGARNTTLEYLPQLGSAEFQSLFFGAPDLSSSHEEEPGLHRLLRVSTRIWKLNEAGTARFKAVTEGPGKMSELLKVRYSFDVVGKVPRTRAEIEADPARRPQAMKTVTRRFVIENP